MEAMQYLKQNCSSFKIPYSITTFDMRFSMSYLVIWLQTKINANSFKVDYFIGCHENSDLENLDLRPQKIQTH